jgi:fructokinase
MRIWSIGEVLWDVFADHETFGGAPLNFCANLQRLGDQALLLSAVGDDPHGRLALERMRALGLTTEGIRVTRDLPTGVAIVNANELGEPTFAIPRPAAFDAVTLDRTTLAAAHEAQIDWLYFGTLLQTSPAIEQATTGLATQLTATRCFYDMNLRAGHWNLELVQRLSHLASILKLNDFEAETLFHLTRTGDAPYSLEEFCRAWARAYAIDVVCVTLGPAGCLIYDRGAFHRVPGCTVSVADTVGAGDAFAAAFLHGFHRGWPILRTARFANALGALVASRPGATPEWTVDEILALAVSFGTANPS